MRQAGTAHPSTTLDDPQLQHSSLSSPSQQAEAAWEPPLPPADGRMGKTIH